MTVSGIDRTEDWVGQFRSSVADLSSASAGALGEAIVVAVVDTDDFLMHSRRKGPAWADVQLSAVEAVIGDASAAHGAAKTYYRAPDEWMLTFSGPHAIPLYERALVCVNQIQQEIGRVTELTASIGISHPRQGSTALSVASERAQAVTMRKLITGGDRVIEEGQDTTALNPPPRIDRDLVNRVQQGDHEGVIRLVNEWIDHCARQPGISAEQLQNWTIGQLLFILDLVSARVPGGTADWLTQRPMLLRELVEIPAIHERSYLRLRVSEVLDQLLPPGGRGLAPNKSLLVKADEHMAEHFGDNSLQLSSLADAIWISPYHLAHLFRRERNTTFLQELTGLRMHAARQLLTKSDRPIEEIAQRTGYASAKRFRIVFKREVGCAPTEYRRARGEVPPQRLRRQNPSFG